MPRFRGLSGGIVAIVITVVIANLGNNIVSPLLPDLKDYFGSSAAQVALIATGFGFGRLAMDLPAGLLADRLSSTKLFAAGILLSGLAAALAASANSLEQVIFFRVAMGCGSSLMSTVALVLLVRVAPANQRGALMMVPSPPKVMAIRTPSLPMAGPNSHAESNLAL
jgi:MFS family permease